MVTPMLEPSLRAHPLGYAIREYRLNDVVVIDCAKKRTINANVPRIGYYVPLCSVLLCMRYLLYHMLAYASRRVLL